MPDPKWIVSNGQNQPVAGNALNGLYIKKTANNYELYAKIGSVAKNPGPNSLPVTFENVTIAGVTWDIVVDSLPSASDAGSWTTPSQHALRSEDTPPTQGDFTAATDGAFTGEEEEAAAAAGYGNQ